MLIYPEKIRFCLIGRPLAVSSRKDKNIFDRLQMVAQCLYYVIKLTQDIFPPEVDTCNITNKI